MKTNGLLAIALFIVAFGTVLSDGTAKTGDIEISNVWAMANDNVKEPGAVFLNITNKGGPDKLLSMETPIAGLAQMHNSKMKGTKMRMRRMEAMDIPGGKTMEFKHGGTHVMLIKLKRPLKMGETFPLTLIFEKAGAITFDVPVRMGKM